MPFGSLRFLLLPGFSPPLSPEPNERPNLIPTQELQNNPRADISPGWFWSAMPVTRPSFGGADAFARHELPRPPLG